jgi:hypothetical protein
MPFSKAIKYRPIAPPPFLQSQLPTVYVDYESVPE